MTLSVSDLKMRVLGIEYFDAGPDGEDRRVFIFDFIDGAGRKRGQVFKSCRWRVWERMMQR